MPVGNIPKKIVYIYSEHKNVKVHKIDGFETEETHTVTPAFVSDAENQKTKETGRSWAKSYNYWTKDKDIEVKEEERENTPFSGFKVVSLEHRSQGGRAWKVVTQDGFYFDFREDILLDAMLHGTLNQGFFVDQEFVWARVGSEMKIIRVGSDLYNDFVKKEETTAGGKIPVKDLKYGGVYTNKRDEEFIYFGKVNTINFEYKIEYYTEGWSRKYRETLEAKEEKNIHLLFEKKKYDPDPLKGKWGWSLVKSPTLYNQIGHEYYDFEELKKSIKKVWKGVWNEYRKDYKKYDGYTGNYGLTSYGCVINAVKPPEKPVDKTPEILQEFANEHRV